MIEPHLYFLLGGLPAYSSSLLPLCTSSTLDHSFTTIKKFEAWEEVQSALLHLHCRLVYSLSSNCFGRHPRLVGIAPLLHMDLLHIWYLRRSCSISYWTGNTNTISDHSCADLGLETMLFLQHRRLSPSNIFSFLVKVYSSKSISTNLYRRLANR